MNTIVNRTGKYLSEVRIASNRDKRWGENLVHRWLPPDGEIYFFEAVADFYDVLIVPMSGPPREFYDVPLTGRVELE